MEKLDVITKKVDVLPMVKYYMDQLGIYDLFAKYVRNPMRSPVDSAQILSIMVANIVCASRPLYKIEQWASDYMDGLSEYNFNASIYNDDQLARKLVPFRGIDVGGESEPFRVSSTLPPNSITRDTITYFVDDQGHRLLTKCR